MSQETSTNTTAPGRALSAQRRRVERICGNCGCRFTGYSWAKFCGAYCRTAGASRRRRKNAEPVETIVLTAFGGKTTFRDSLGRTWICIDNGGQ